MEIFLFVFYILFLFIYFTLFFKAEAPYVARLALNSRSSQLSLLSAGITGMHQHVGFKQRFLVGYIFSPILKYNLHSKTLSNSKNEHMHLIINYNFIL
jgi:hypothetical protein